MNQSETKRTPLQVGFSKVDITPDYPVSMAGSAASRVSEGALDALFISFIALRQDESTVLIATMDLVCSYEEFAAPVRAAISRAVGIGEESILLNATHTHSSVALRYAEGVGISRYREDFCRLAIEAAREALSDLSPAELFYGSIQTEKMVWVRHYKMTDGSFAGANYGSFSSGILGHVWEADGEMQLLRFVREEQKPDVILMNFPAHATINQKSRLLSADFPAPARDELERQTGARVAYFIAAGGDQVPISRVSEENFSKDYLLYGKELARLALAGLEGLRKAEEIRLRFLTKKYDAPSNKAELDRADEALAVGEIWKKVGGRGTAEGKAAALAHGFSSVYEVTAILNRMHFAPTRTLALSVLSFGEAGMVFAPYEMFSANAKQIKSLSPMAMTFIVSCSQNHAGYLPDEDGWRLRCYEAQITKLERGTAEKLAAEYVDLLKEIRQI